MFKKCKKEDFFNDKVKCDECRAYFDKSDTQEIKVIITYTEILYGYDFNSEKIEYLYYCPAHKKNYTYTRYKENLFGDISNQTFYKEFEVLEDGTPLGYKKQKQNG